MYWQVSFRSPQQLREFNMPFQLGKASDGDAHAPSFETPHDASVRRTRPRIP